jgi:hypothetical protein
VDGVVDMYLMRFVVYLLCNLFLFGGNVLFCNENLVFCNLIRICSGSLAETM